MTIQKVVRPGVEIQQVFLETAPTLVNPDLPTVIVGSNVQVKDLGAGGNFAMGVNLVTAYPELEDGAIVDLASVQVKMTQMFLQVFDGGATKATLAGDQANIFPNPGDPDFVSENVQPGDIFIASQTIAGVTTTYEAKVITVNNANSLTLDRDLSIVPEFATPVDFRVKRAHIDLFLLPAAFTATPDDVTVLGTLTVDGLPVLSGVTQVSYRAQRQLTAEVLTNIAQTDDIATKLGVVSIENPLALGAFLAKANTVSSVLTMGIKSDSPVDWLAALDRLQSEQVYTIVLLTQDPTIQSLVRTHVEQMSLPEKSAFRITFINLAHPVETLAVEPLSAATMKRAGGVLTIQHPNAEFSRDVRVGDFVETIARVAVVNPTNDPTHVGFWKVIEVTNATTLKLASQKYAGADGVYVASGPALAVDFPPDAFDMEVVRVLDRQGQAEAIAARASGFNSRRVTYITNAECVITLPDPTTGQNADIAVPGYYLAAAYGGMNAGFPPHQGFTNVGVSAIKSVRYGHKYFTDDQQKLIAGSGGFLVIQETDDGLPFAFLQTTTDNSSIQRRELSVTKTLDYYSIGLKAVLKKFVGPYNVFKGTLVALNNDVEAYHSRLLGQRFDKIGSPILSGKVAEVVEDPFEVDTVRLRTLIDVPVPLNYIKARVEVVA
jgi:hypothetical protein